MRIDHNMGSFGVGIYYLNDIWWIYSEDGCNVYPYMFTTETRIKELISGFEFELPKGDDSLSDKIKAIFEKHRGIDASQLTIKKFEDLQNSDVLSNLKGFSKIKHSLLTKSIELNRRKLNATFSELTRENIVEFRDLISRSLEQNFKHSSKSENDQTFNI